MNVDTLDKELKDCPEKIEIILKKLGLEPKYKESQKMFSMARLNGDNPNGILCYSNSLRVVGNTDSSLSGNIYTLVMNIKKCNFPKSLDYVGSWLNIKNDDKPTNIHLPFGGFYKSIIGSAVEPENYQKIYEWSSLPSDKNLSKRFLDDGISLQVQEEYGIRYDHESDSILIPITHNGRLVGCKGRSNQENCPHDKRWFAYLPFSKTLNVYGYDLNYAGIIQKDTAIIFESEKSVAQLHSMGINCGIAVAGHNISDVQAKIIKSLGCKKIIVAFDSDISFDEAEYNAKKLIVNTQLFNNKVGVMYDFGGDLLGGKASKNSPTDVGLNIFKKLYKENITWVKEN